MLLTLMISRSRRISRSRSASVVAVAVTMLGVLLDDSHPLFHDVKLAQNLLKNGLRKEEEWSIIETSSIIAI